MLIKPASQLYRREFLTWSSRGFATFLYAANTGAAWAANARAQALFENLDELVELLPPDSNGLRLPPGFQSRVIARSGSVVKTVGGTSAYYWHNAPDGGACFATDDSGWIYVSNSEVKVQHGGGGVGAVRFDAAGGIVSAYPILEHTNNNCAGGKTPWQTWLSCEEVERGLIYECDPFGRNQPAVRPALGCFRHEAVAVDPRRSHLYLTEDEDDGAFYRFVPAGALPDLSAGTLQVAEIVSGVSGMHLVWHDVADPDAIHTPTRYQVAAASPFNGGEGIAWHEGAVYFTTKGDNRVWRHDTNSGELTVLYDATTSATPHLSGVDNIVISASGDVLVAEDGGDMQIVMLTESGNAIPVVQVVGQDASEICGPAFDPSFQRLYFSSQTGPSNSDADGIVYEISRVV